MLEDRAATQRHLNRLEKQAARISKLQENVNSCTWDGKIPVQAGDKWLESSLAEKELVVLIVKWNMSKQGVLAAMRLSAY